MTSYETTPRPLRASDADRQAAISALSDHYTDGRLDSAEFEARMSAASQAVFVHDLAPLFVDLPSREITATGPWSARSPEPWARPRRGHHRPHLLPLAVLLLVVSVAVPHRGPEVWPILLMLWVAVSLLRRVRPQGWGAPGTPPRRW